MSSSSSPTSSPTSSTPFFTNSPSATSAPTSDNTENSSSLYLQVPSCAIQPPWNSI
ncbi:hypothetical protein PILCRDRAFT_813248 [Piloderma croceum F 1598]|uniref:Uncharacterized protein n=1 Tax=Piloderma croceum (strain F 1598) TaxID=765440 RepID=A0A0C3GC64_PILCF|nr:hypothetical protein PILCRDRAFT_813248 [Piloderma croceum F 1598]